MMSRESFSFLIYIYIEMFGMKQAVIDQSKTTPVKGGHLSGFSLECNSSIISSLQRH